MKYTCYYCEQCGETMLPPFEDDEGNISRTTCNFCGEEYKNNIKYIEHVWVKSPFTIESLNKTIENHKNKLRANYLSRCKSKEVI